MGTTVEPPYLHKSAGVATRNGTTTHVVTFSTDGDAPFTPTNGSFLVFVMFGAVTHTVSTGGWTEQLQPVSSGELSVFTVTASSTTSITVVHNGSNYPALWTVFEYPAGSTYTSGAGTTPTTDTVGTLSSLPGTAQLIIAAVGRVASGTTSASASGVWTAPFIEDSDQFTVFATTDGGFLTVAHAINQTATSVTPVMTPTYGALPGNWAINDRENVVFAINAVAPSVGTHVDKDTSFTWRVFNTVNKDAAFSWNVYNSINKDTSFSWRVLNAINKDTSFTWNVYNTVNKDTSFSWNVYNTVNKDTSFTWRVYNALTKDTSFTWNVYNGINKDTPFSWNVYNTVNKDTSFTWNVLSATGVVSDYPFTWNVYNTVNKDTSFTWRVFNALTKDTNFTWNVLNAITKDTSFTWRVYNLINKDTSFTWDVLAGTHVNKDTDFTWRIYNNTFKSQTFIWNVLGVSSITLKVWNGTSEVSIVSLTVWSGVTELPASITSIT